MSDVKQTLREMAKLSLISNKINPIQEKNLKAFGKVFFEGVSTGTVDYDFSNAALIDTEENKKALIEKEDAKAALALRYKFNKVDTEHFRVSYYLKIDEDVEQTHLEKRFQAIEGAVRTLFYSDVKVEVFFNDRKVFESKS